MLCDKGFVSSPTAVRIYDTFPSVLEIVVAAVWLFSGVIVELVVVVEFVVAVVVVGGPGAIVTTINSDPFPASSSSHVLCQCFRDARN